MRNNGWWLLICYFLGVTLLALMLFSCRTIKYVDVPSVHYEYTHSTDTIQHRDSVYLHDSVWVEKWLQGDTVYITKYKERWQTRIQWRNKVVAKDSIIRDTVSHVKYIEKELSKAQKRRILTGKYVERSTIGLLCVLLVAGVIWAYRRFNGH